MVKRIMITLSDEQYDILRKLDGLGSTDAAKARGAIVAYLSEHGHIGLAQGAKKE